MYRTDKLPQMTVNGDKSKMKLRLVSLTALAFAIVGQTLYTGSALAEPFTNDIENDFALSATAERMLPEDSEVAFGEAGVSRDGTSAGPALCRKGQGACKFPKGLARLEGANSLTDEQREKLYELKGKLIEEAGPIKSKLASYKHQMRGLFLDPAASTEEIKALSRKITEARAAIADLRTDNILAARAQLTEAQIKELRQKTLLRGPRKGMKHRRLMRGSLPSRSTAAGEDVADDA